LPKDLFGLDLDKDTIARCANQFEQDRKRWEAASFEEWCAGIDEIAVKFTNVLDTVRTTQLPLLYYVSHPFSGERSYNVGLVNV